MSNIKNIDDNIIFSEGLQYSLAHDIVTLPNSPSDFSYIMNPDNPDIRPIDDGQIVTIGGVDYIRTKDSNGTWLGWRVRDA